MQRLSRAEAQPSRRWLSLLAPFTFALCLALLLGACSQSDEQPVDRAEVMARPIQPTFTPTPTGSTPANAPTAIMSAAVLEPEVAAPLVVNLPTPQANTTPAPNPPPATQSNGAPQIAAPIVVVNAVLVNVRAGPSTNNSILKVAERGDQYNVIGRLPDSSWWQICCVDGQEGWINHEFVDSDGPVESVPVIAQVAQLAAPQSNAGQSAQPTATNAALATAPPDNNGAFEFDLALTEQFPDTNVMHVFLYVFDNNGALAGYSLRATRNGVELPIQAAASFGPQPGLTWPIADSRQRFQNYKVEFPGEPSGGTWEVQLVKDGKPVGPPARFQLKDNDPNRELYVRYQKK